MRACLRAWMRASVYVSVSVCRGGRPSWIFLRVRFAEAPVAYPDTVSAPSIFLSNLSFISKTLERLVSLQLLPYLENSGLLPTYQSGFRANHSAETALLSLLSDIYSAIDKSQLSLLALFDVSTAFDMVDHQILLERLETSCGISYLPLLWIKSYLSDRTQMIVSGESRTSLVPIFLGVPQGSGLGPLLFILYTADISTLFSKYSATGHLFDDDVQAYVHGPPSSQLLLASKIELLSNDLNSWMSSNRLSLNSAKTQLIWFGTSTTP